MPETRARPDASLRTPNPEPGGRLSVDLEEFFRHADAALQDGRPDARAAAVPPPGFVSYGVGVAEDLPWIERAAGLGLAAVRRSSGGTGLLHGPGDLLWSLVLPRSDARVGRDFVRAYDRLGAPVVAALGRLGVDAAWLLPPGTSDTYCTLGSRGRVLTVRGQIVGGAAQHATSKALLHHGTVSWTVDRNLLLRLFDLAPGEAAALEGLAQLGIRAGPDELSEALEQELRSFVGGAPR